MPQHHDVYFFLYPPPSVAATAARLLCDLRVPPQSGNRAPMPEHRLHITLQSLGRFVDRIPDEVLRLARAVGGAADDEPFDVALDLLRSRGGSDGAGTLELAGRGTAVRALRRFQRGLGDTMRRMGFPEDQIRSAFSPHITLDYAHERVARQLVAPLAWPVTEFFLVDSLFGLGKHEVLGRWPLHARQQAFPGW